MEVIRSVTVFKSFLDILCFYYVCLLHQKLQINCETLPAETMGAVRLSPLGVQSGIRRQDGPGLTGKHANFSRHLCNTVHRRL